MAKAGRKPKLTEDFIKEFCELIGEGLNNIDACNYMGIDESSFYNWKNDAKRELEEGKTNTLKIKFLESLKKAETGFKLSHLQNIKRASEQDWKASAWTLERKFPNEFGQRVQADVGVQKIEVVNSMPTSEDNNIDED